MNHSQLSHKAGTVDDSTTNIVVVIIIIIIKQQLLALKIVHMKICVNP